MQIIKSLKLSFRTYDDLEKEGVGDSKTLNSAINALLSKRLMSQMIKENDLGYSTEYFLTPKGIARTPAASPAIPFSRRLLTRAGAATKMRISKSETNSKLEIQMFKTNPSTCASFGFWSFGFWICFVFRASDFVFPTCAHGARILRTETLARLRLQPTVACERRTAGAGQFKGDSTRSSRMQMVGSCPLQRCVLGGMNEGASLASRKTPLTGDSVRGW